MVNDADGSEYPTRAVYDEVRAPELLVWTESHSGMRVRSEFVALGPGPHRGQDPPDLRARGVPGPRGPGRVPVLARPLRRVSRRARPRRERRATPHRKDDRDDGPRATRARRRPGRGHRRRVRARWPTCWSRPARRLGRAVAVRGLAHPRGGGAHDDAGARTPVRRSWPSWRRPAATSPACPTPSRARDGALPVATLLADLRSAVLHGWQPPGGGLEGALTHCVIHELDIIEAVPLERRVPDHRVSPVLESIVAGGRPASSASTSPAWSCGPTTWTGPTGPARSSRARRRRSPSWRAAGPCPRAGSAASAAVNASRGPEAGVAHCRVDLRQD